MLLGILPLVVIVTVVAVLWRGSRRGGGAGADPPGLRRFFVLLVLYFAVVLAAIGVSGLLGQLLATDRLVTSTSDAARNGAFAVVGLPVAITLGLYVRRSFRTDAAARSSVGWSAYLTATTLTALVTAASAGIDVLYWALRIRGYDSTAVSGFVVWSAVWAGHWPLARRLLPHAHAQLPLLGGSLIGLATAATGVVTLLGGTLDVVLRLDRSALSGDEDRIRRGAAVLVIGALIWFVYWVRTAVHRERTPLWTGYVLLAGVGAGTVGALVGAGHALFDSLVWVLGDPGTTPATIHFRSDSTALAAVACGVAVWWYHRAVLGHATGAPRDELRRLDDHLLAALGLLTAAAGAVIVVVGVIELATSGAALAGTPPVNLLLGGVTLALIGTPLWAVRWRRTLLAARDGTAERTSPTRRIYVLLLAGVGVLVALGALVALVYLGLEDALGPGLAVDTLRRLRYPIGLLLAAGAVAGYHAALYRRERVVEADGEHRPRYVLLVGPRDPVLEHDVADAVGARVHSWPRTDHDEPVWSADDVAAAVRAAHAPDVVVVADSGGVHAIPVRRH